jgi:hypothetical protein
MEKTGWVWTKRVEDMTTKEKLEAIAILSIDVGPSAGIRRTFIQLNLSAKKKKRKRGGKTGKLFDIEDKELGVKRLRG